MIGHVSSRWEWGQWDTRLPDLPARPERNGGKSTEWSGRGAGEREDYGEGLKPISDLLGILIMKAVNSNKNIVSIELRVNGKTRITNRYEWT